MFTEDEILNGNNEIAAAIVIAGKSIAYALHCLGTGDAASNMGAIEYLATHLGEKIDGLSNSVDEINKSLD